MSIALHMWEETDTLLSCLTSKRRRWYPPLHFNPELPSEAVDVVTGGSLHLDGVKQTSAYFWQLCSLDPHDWEWYHCWLKGSEISHSRLVYKLRVLLDSQWLLKEQVATTARKAFAQIHLVCLLCPLCLICVLHKIVLVWNVSVDLMFIYFNGPFQVCALPRVHWHWLPNTFE